MRKILMASAVLAGLFGFSGSAALATTVNNVVDFDGGTSTGGAIKTYTEAGFSFYDARIVGGPCASGSCAAVNKHETTVLTYNDGESFDLTSIWFYLNGGSKNTSNAFTIYDTNDMSHVFNLTQSTYAQNQAYVVGLDFFGVTSITFESTGDKKNTGNARFDFVSAVPVPAGGLLLFAALGGLAALRRRKSV